MQSKSNRSSRRHTTQTEKHRVKNAKAEADGAERLARQYDAREEALLQAREKLRVAELELEALKKTHSRYQGVVVAEVGEMSEQFRERMGIMRDNSRVARSESLKGVANTSATIWELAADFADRVLDRVKPVEELNVTIGTGQENSFAENYLSAPLWTLDFGLEKGMNVLVTGPEAAGKTRWAHAMLKAARARGLRVEVVDDLRAGFKSMLTSVGVQRIQERCDCIIFIGDSATTGPQIGKNYGVHIHQHFKRVRTANGGEWA